ncbi:MAG TPA: isoamylase [Longimicrobiaceae bacterium]|nr:isoamylase [Longimicrobiaceae bacterium]
MTQLESPPDGSTPGSPGGAECDRPAGSWRSREGEPAPQGVSWIEGERAFNFALYSKHAESVRLLLYSARDVETPVLTYDLDARLHKSGRMWHCRVPEREARDALYYAYAVSGPQPRGRYEWHAFDPEKILLDPYARGVFFPPAFERGAAMHPGSNAGRAPLGVIHDDEEFSWGADTAPRHESELIIYELHVRGFTAHESSGVAPERRGTYTGLIDRIPYLVELGVTAVELMPVFQWDPQEGNYWGYMPLSFFAPHSGFATRGGAQRREFKEMVRALHAAGIEVILDVVYNHTAEGGPDGPVYSYKGIDNSTYYLISGDPNHPYSDYSGTGNTIHSANAHVRELILDSLRYWVEEMHVDGFRFDLASVFTRDDEGAVDLRRPGIIAQISADPVLDRVRLIAEPWDSAGTDQLGPTFPGPRWAQWNDHFRDDVRRFVRGDAGLAAALATRLYGSADVFPDDLMHAARPCQSINYLTCHDGFTLYDLVSYEQKRNWANGQANADGPQENHSWNCGWEGDDGVPEDVRALRTRQAKNYCILLLLANGVPMLRAGDEFLQTQGGNDNPYNQDNPTSWLDWGRLATHAEVHRFFREAIAFRKAHPAIGRSRFWREDVSWYGRGPVPEFGPESRELAYCLRGAREADCDLYVMVNSSPDDLDFTVQDGARGDWRRTVDTALAAPDDIRAAGAEVPLASAEYRVRARSVVVLSRRCRG